MYIPNQRYIYFVGIGGVGMSGIAELFHNLGYLVKGSNNVENNYTKRLQSLGIDIHIGHESYRVQNAQVVVVSSDIPESNVEISHAKTLNIPVIKRAEMLAELMRLKQSVAVAGSHGKTTITSLAGALLQEGGKDPTIVNGGIINAYKTNVRLGQGEWIVVEADESDGSFEKLSPTIAIVTNIDPEHMNHYKSMDVLKAAFERFVSKIPFYGLAILCADHPMVSSLVIRDRRIITYGFSESVHVRAINIRLTPEGAYFDVVLTERRSMRLISLPQKLKDIFIPMVGRHNVLNSLSVIALAVEMGFSEDIVRSALSNFQGVKRRFTRTGVAHQVAIIDDYAHHPEEIKATIDAARQTTNGRVIVVAQPHRYSRLSSLFLDFVTCFDKADALFIAPVYAAGESPIPGISSESLCQKIQERHSLPYVSLVTEDTLADSLAEYIQPGDIVLCLGAGNITYWAHQLPDQLQRKTLLLSSCKKAS